MKHFVRNLNTFFLILFAILEYFLQCKDIFLQYLDIFCSTWCNTWLVPILHRPYDNIDAIFASILEAWVFHAAQERQRNLGKRLNSKELKKIMDQVYCDRVDTSWEKTVEANKKWKGEILCIRYTMVAFALLPSQIQIQIQIQRLYAPDIQWWFELVPPR